jgi:hypothetical protein
MTLNFSDRLTDAPAADDGMPDEDEQRREGRAQTVYLPCCLRAGERCTVGLIRNISPAGLLVETDIAAEPGSEVAYFQDTAQWRRARVVWRDGRRVGLQNIDDGIEEPPAFPHRAIRVPTTLMARMWLDGRAIEIGIGNLSPKGVLAFGVPPIEQGQPVTLTVVGREFANTSLRWWAHGNAGLQFERPMTLRAMNELIGFAERSGSGFYFERRIAELLEGVSVNDERA